MVFFKTFLKKKFLSDQEVPGCHKNIYRELRTSFTRSEIFGNMCCFFRQQTQHLLPSLGTGSPKGALWEFVRKVIFSLFDPKNRFSAFNGPINIAGGRLDILFHFPNDWYNNIEGQVEKIKIDFLPWLRTQKVTIFWSFCVYLTKTKIQF